MAAMQYHGSFGRPSLLMTPVSPLVGPCNTGDLVPAYPCTVRCNPLNDASCSELQVRSSLDYNIIVIAGFGLHFFLLTLLLQVSSKKRRSAPDFAGSRFVRFQHWCISLLCLLTSRGPGSMKVVLPGKPEARLQALATGFWKSRRIIVSVRSRLPQSLPHVLKASPRRT